MSIQISIRVPAGSVSAIRGRVRQRIAAGRSQLVQSATNAALTVITDSTPVQTGTARGGWESERDRIAGSQPISLSEHVSHQSATNSVDHIVYLEYGTSRMQPRATVRTVLARLESAVHSMFRLGN